jgi:hypothetical protein
MTIFRSEAFQILITLALIGYTVWWAWSSISAKEARFGRMIFGRSSNRAWYWLIVGFFAFAIALLIGMLLDEAFGLDMRFWL